MSAFKVNIENETLKNNNYRNVINTTPQMQLVLMNLLPREDIGFEVHKKTTQFIRVEKGSGVAFIGPDGSERVFVLKDGDSITIYPNTRHNIKAGKDGLKLYTIYSPPEHKDKTVQLEKI